jgi:hypothetical protein
VADGTFDTFTSAGKASAWFLVAAPEPGEDDEA